MSNVISITEKISQNKAKAAVAKINNKINEGRYHYYPCDGEMIEVDMRLIAGVKLGKFPANPTEDQMNGIRAYFESVDVRIEMIDAECALMEDEIKELEEENKQLRAKVKSLKSHIKKLERRDD